MVDIPQNSVLPLMFVVIPSLEITKEELTLLIQEAYVVFHQDDEGYVPLEVCVMGVI